MSGLEVEVTVGSWGTRVHEKLDLGRTLKSMASSDRPLRSFLVDNFAIQ